MEYLLKTKGMFAENSLTVLIRHWHQAGQSLEPALPKEKPWNALTLPPTHPPTSVFPKVNTAQMGKRRAKNEAVLSDRASVFFVGLRGDHIIDYFYYGRTNVLIADRVRKTYYWKRMPPNWQERPIEEIIAFAADGDLKKLVVVI